MVVYGRLSLSTASDKLYELYAVQAQVEAEATIQRISKQPVRLRLHPFPFSTACQCKHAYQSALTTRQGVLGCIIINKDGVVLRTTCEVRTLCVRVQCGSLPHTRQCLTSWAQAEVTKAHAQLIPDLAAMARSMVRELDPQVSTPASKYLAVSSCQTHTHALYI